ncbi:hypothetical protein GCM10009113_08150 [Marinobacter szutsaonensis]
MTQFKKGLFTRNLMATAILAPMMIVAGCSDNDGSPLPPGETPSGVSEGFAYDGYLVGATVCVDENLNKACDEGEPSTTTGDGGQFSLVGLTDAQLLTPLVLEANENTTDGGLPVDPNLKFLAPAGSEAISGFSTVIQMKVESKLAAGSTATLAELKASAAAELATELGVQGIDLTTYDPIATFASASSNEKRTAAELHLVNQVLSAQIVDLIADVDVVLESNPGLSETAAFGALVESLNPANVVAVVQEFSDAGATANDLDGYSAETIMSSGTGTYEAPTAPDATAIEEQATQDEAAQAELEDAIVTEEPPTGATGGTGS